MSRAERGVPGRFLRSELRLVFRRRRNLALLVALALVPVLVAVAVDLSGRPGGGGSILGALTDNGIFAALAGLLVTGPLFLPVVVSVVAGDAVAGEASAGTLRYLLVAPVGRGRLLAVKLAAILAWTLVAALAVAVLGLLAGLVLFPSGPVTLLSGTTVSYAAGVGRLALAVLYVAASTATVGALGLFVSTLTEVPLAAMAATLVVTIASEVVDAVPQLAAVGPWLPTHYWLRWVDLLRTPVPTHGLVTGLLVSLAYVAFFGSAAWARFGARDVTS